MSITQNSKIRGITDSTLDDITQEVFIQAHVHLSQFRGDSSIKTWLFTIARNKCNDHFRSAIFRKIIPSSHSMPLSTTSSAEDQVLHRENYSQLVQWILRLPRGQEDQCPHGNTWYTIRYGKWGAIVGRARKRQLKV